MKVLVENFIKKMSIVDQFFKETFEKKFEGKEIAEFIDLYTSYQEVYSIFLNRKKREFISEYLDSFFMEKNNQEIISEWNILKNHYINGTFKQNTQDFYEKVKATFSDFDKVSKELHIVMSSLYYRNYSH